MSTRAAAPLLLSPPDVGELERSYLLEAFDSGWVGPVGPDLAAFEREAAAAVGAGHAVALSSGTAALHLALVLAGVGPGDRVLVPSFTFVATANAVTYTGAEPVFVDCTASTWTIDPDLVADAVQGPVGQRPSAVVGVDVYGQCADYDRLADVCAGAGVAVVEDAAESLGSTYRGRRAGGLGATAVLSFNGNKIITTGGGGMLLTPHEHLADRARYLATQARDAVPHYEHAETGYNYRLSNLLAAVGRAQLVTLPERVERRRATYRAYADGLRDVRGVELMPLAGYGRSNCWLTCVLVDPDEFGATGEQLCQQLQASGIEARRTWKPMHLQPVFSGRRVLGGRVSEDLFARGVALPSGSAMTAADVERVVDAVRAASLREVAA